MRLQLLMLKPPCGWSTPLRSIKRSVPAAARQMRGQPKHAAGLHPLAPQHRGCQALRDRLPHQQLPMWTLPLPIRSLSHKGPALPWRPLASSLRAQQQERHKGRCARGTHPSWPRSSSAWTAPTALRTAARWAPGSRSMPDQYSIRWRMVGPSQ